MSAGFVGVCSELVRAMRRAMVVRCNREEEKEEEENELGRNVCVCHMLYVS